MSFKQKNTVVTLVSFSLILIFFLLRILQLVQNDNFVDAKVIRLWIIVALLAVFFTIIATILTHIVIAIIEIVQTGNDAPEIDDFEDERDKFIDLRGTSITHTTSSIGAFVAMLTYALGQPPLIMFTLLIFFGVSAQIVGDIFRLLLYRRGF